MESSTVLRPTIGWLVILLCGVLTPVSAGNLYVPIVSTEIDGIPFETQVLVSNPGTAAAQYTPYFIPINTDGVARDDGDEPSSVLLLPGKTVQMVYGTDGLGMLEFDSDPGLVFHSRLVGVFGGGESVGTAVPFVSRDNAVPAGETAHVQGWMRTEDALMTHFGVMNLGSQTAECSVDVRVKDGPALIEGFVSTWEPLSHRLFPEALNLLGQVARSDARAAVTCNQPFYPYAVVFDRNTGEARFLTPSSTGASGFQAPGQGPQCPVGSTCFSEPGIFHVPSRNFPVKRLSWNIPQGGVFKRVRVRLDVTLGEWYPPKTNGTHNIYWFVRNGNQNIIGYVNLRGPGRNQVFVVTNIGKPDHLPGRDTAGIFVEPGETYHFDYTFDMRQGFSELVVSTESGQVLVDGLGRAPYVNSLALSPSDDIIMDLGFPEFPGEPGSNDVATFGWVYQDLFLEFTP
jgi:hypothetical protein